jgi:DNA primase
MNQTPIQSVLQRLKDVKQTEAGWKALCPAHKDGDPSLSIKEAADGKVILNCYAGCEFNAIYAAVGL